MIALRLRLAARQLLAALASIVPAARQVGLSARQWRLKARHMLLRSVIGPSVGIVSLGVGLFLRGIIGMN